MALESGMMLAARGTQPEALVVAERFEGVFGRLSVRRGRYGGWVVRVTDALPPRPREDA